MSPVVHKDYLKETLEEFVVETEEVTFPGSCLPSKVDIATVTLRSIGGPPPTIHLKIAWPWSKEENGHGVPVMPQHARELGNLLLSLADRVEAEREEPKP